MLLEAHEVEVLFRLHRTLMFYVNRRLNVLPDELATPEEFARLVPPPARIKVREALLANLSLLDEFVAENPGRFPEEELEIARSWRHFMAGKFYIVRDLAKYTVFLSDTAPAVAYGVVAITQPLWEILGPDLPRLVNTVLLPFRGRIVYDGLINGYNVVFGPGICASLDESYKEAKDRQGIITSLPPSNRPRALKTPTARPAPKPPAKQDKDEVLGEVLRLLEEFCKAHLNEEYAVICKKMAVKLARKRPSPLLQGTPNAWASGIVRAVGAVNFLHDKSQPPYMRATDIDHHLGTSPSTGALRVAAIRKMLRIHPLEPEWTLPSRLERNPLVWTLKVNGLLMDVRDGPRDLQEVAFKKGLIPYIPADGPPGA